ncbi:MAG: DUF4380 domain-containing protein [Pseudomonadota bacterium]
MKIGLFFVLAGIFGVAMADEKVHSFQLKNGVIQAEITADIGGRLLSFSLANKPNFLKIGEAVVANPNPIANSEADAIGYLGHEMWVGPQSQWWSQQTINSSRAAAKAEWPPDPYLALAKNKILENSPKKIVLQSPESPVSGLKVTKSFSFAPNKKNSIELKVTAKNIRKESVAWDVWFNTRVSAATRVYVPVANEKDVRIKLFEDTVQNAFVPRIQQKIFSLDLMALSANKNAGKVKLMIQPTAGWMAGFHDEQAFIVQFPHQPLLAIHPEQGQVELYFDYVPNQVRDGLIEMEVHTPYKNLLPGEEMVGNELWTILPYTGAPTYDAQVAFLREQAKILGLNGL